MKSNVFKGCKQEASSVSGFTTSSCKRPETGSFVPTSVQGFTRDGMKACFYANSGCTTESTSDYVMFAGGDRVSDGSCLVIQDGMQIQSWQVTKGNC